MRVHYLQHVPFEGLGSIGSWLRARAATVSATKLYEGVELPVVHDFDWLIVLGGPMSVNDEREHPWLVPEKRLIADAIAASKVVLGICLGAQLIASALGNPVFPNREREIGWFSVGPPQRPSVTALSSCFAEPLDVFHWHGETFELPAGATHLARSEACEIQAFSIGDHVLGLQFHLETTPELAKALVDQSRDELVDGPFVQSEREMLGDPNRFEPINEAMSSVLQTLCGRGRR